MSDNGMSERKSVKSSKKSKKTTRSIKSTDPKPCCCCMCTCNDEITEKERCCGCFPVKFGMAAIGVFTLLLFFVYLFIEVLDFGNTHFKWWYPAIYILLYIPLAITAFLFFNYFMGTDQDAARKKLPFAVWLAILSLVLSSVWRMIYILAIYDEDEVYEGGKPWAEDDYKKTPKKNYIVWDVITTTALLFLFGYFLYFVMANNALYDKYYEEHPLEDEENKEGDDEEKKPMMEGEEMMGE